VSEIQGVPIVEWDTFITKWPTVYRQDQHVTIIGPTGCGKTTLAIELLKCRALVVAFGVKHVDETLEGLVKRDKWHRVEEWKLRPKTAQRVVLWPKVRDLDKVLDVHRKRFNDAFKSIYKIGHWTIYMDEETYLADHAGLRKVIRSMYILARSNRISLVGSAQRPSWLPLEAYNQAAHLLIFRTGHEADIAKMGSLNGANAKTIAQVVKALPTRHHFLHLNLLDGTMSISKVTKKG
jgi:hypothetical protein